MNDAEYYEVDAIKDLLKLPFIDSVILDSKRVECLLDLCNFTEASQWKLLYRGSRDGFACESFHEKVRNYYFRGVYLNALLLQPGTIVPGCIINSPTN